MSDMTGKLPMNTYKDLLQVSNSNAGVDATPRPVEDGEGTQCPLQVSTTAVRVTATPSHNDDVATKGYVDTNSGGAFENAFLYVRDEKASSVNGGTAATGSWARRDLNTVKHNGITGASLASNQVTLPAGTYVVSGRAPAFGVDGHAARLRNTTAGATLVEGSTGVAGMTQTDSFLNGRFVLAAQSVLEVQHQVTAPQPSFGLGFAHSFGTNVYTELRIWKVA